MSRLKGKHLGVILFSYFVFLLLSIAVFQLDTDKFVPDTVTYITVADEGLAQRDFWAGERPFTVPLFYKLIRFPVSADGIQVVAARATQVQLVLYLIGWGFLAWSVFTSSRSRTSAFLGLWTILIFSLSTHVIQWNRILSSESVSTSLFAFMVGLWIVGLSRLEKKQNSRVWHLFSYLSLMPLVTILYSFSRDANAYFLLFGAVFIGIIALLTFKHSRVLRLLLAAIAALWLVIYLVQDGTANRGMRWFVPFVNIYQSRILPDDEAYQFFLDEGMPEDKIDLANLRAMSRKVFFTHFFNDSRAKSQRLWLAQNGKLSYAYFLFRHPDRMLLNLFQDLDHLISPDSSEYRAAVKPTPDWQTLLTNLFYPRSVMAVLITAVILGLWSIYSASKSGLSTMLLLPWLLLTTSIPMLILVWNADSIEIERHAFQIGMQIRLACWLIIFYLVDHWLLHGKQRCQCKLGIQG